MEINSWRERNSDSAVTYSLPELSLLGQLGERLPQLEPHNDSLVDTEKPVPRDPTKWHKEHEALVKKAESTSPTLVFYGDSITKGMSDGNALLEAFGNTAENFGIVGDSTQHLLWRLENGETNFKTSPKEVVLLVGANNVSNHASASDTVKGILANVREIREKLPEAKVLVLGVLPQGKTAKDPRRAVISELNKELSAELNGQANVSFTDLGPSLLEKDGTMSPLIWWGDGLHPRDYTPIFDQIKPILESMEKAAPPISNHIIPLSPWEANPVIQTEHKHPSPW
jgi:lysophospholipase L1-like esterase